MVSTVRRMSRILKDSPPMPAHPSAVRLLTKKASSSEPAFLRSTAGGFPRLHCQVPAPAVRLAQAALRMSETVALVPRSRASSAALAAWSTWVRAVELAWAAARVTPS